MRGAVITILGIFLLLKTRKVEAKTNAQYNAFAADLRLKRISESWSRRGKQHHLQEIEDGLYRIAFYQGIEVAQEVERMLRWETAHFTSEGFRLTRAAGMEAVSKTYPYGWSLPVPLWTNNPDVRPAGLTRMIDSGNRDVQFITFKHVYHAMLVMADYIVRYRAGRWYSLNESNQEMYERKLSGVKNRIIV